MACNTGYSTKKIGCISKTDGEREGEGEGEEGEEVEKGEGGERCTVQ